MKPTFARLSLTMLALGVTIQAAPFLAIGDGAELFATGMVGVRADDNIFTAANAQSDTIFDISPGVELTFGKDADLKGALTLVDAFSSYSSNSNLNTNLFSGDFRSNYDDGKMKLSFNAGFHELNQNTEVIHGLTRRDATSLGGKGEIEVSQITSLAAGVTFTHNKFKRTGYANSDDYVVPVNFYYKWTPKVEVSAGYTFRDYTTTIGSDSQDHFFNVGARGEFTPLLTGEFSVGVTTRNFATGPLSSQSMLGLSAQLNYALTPKTSLQLTSSSAPDTSPQGQQQKNFSLGGTVTSTISDQWSVRGGVNWRAMDYTTRTDDFIEGNLGATYIVNTYVNIAGNYVYRHNKSVLASGVFTENVFSVSANLRY
jgi:hypothetical protein